MKLKLLVMVLLLALVLPTFAQANSVDITKVSIEARDYIALRTLFESLGYKVGWNADTRQAIVQNETDYLQFKPGSRYYLHNGTLVNGIIATTIKEGTMYLSVATMDSLFETYRLRDSQTITITDGLKVRAMLGKLNNQEEYMALMSFYPKKPSYYRTTDHALNAISEGDIATVDAKKTDISDTNNQVDGVAEADLVKHNHDYIFTIYNNALQVFKTGRSQLELIYTHKQTDVYPRQLFLNDNKLIVIGYGIETQLNIINTDKKISASPASMQRQTVIDVYDISALKNKQLKRLKRYSLEGNYLSGRQINDYLYLVLNHSYGYMWPYKTAITEKNNTTSEKTRSFDSDIRYFPGHFEDSVLFTVGIDLNQLDLAGFDMKSYLGYADEIFANQDHLIITSQTYGDDTWRNSTRQTDIFKFNLDAGKVEYLASGTVEGYLLNQFSIGEHAGYLRLATTTQNNSDGKSYNHLNILDKNLKVVGQVKDLAPGERIYSTRMMGDKVFIVTYRQVDPFYVIDTVEPENPKVLGYLKIPGYSNYMHPYDDKTIIGIGMNTVEKKGNIVNDGVKISLFDISDLSNPIEKDQVIIGSGNSYTDVSYDHKAFLFDKAKNIMALPIAAYNSQGIKDKDAYIFSFDTAGKVDLRGVVSHTDLSADKKQYSGRADINRIFYIGDDLYTLSEQWLMISDFNSLKRIDYIGR